MIVTRRMNALRALLAVATTALLALAAGPAGAHTARSSVVGGTPVSQEQFERDFPFQVALLSGTDVRKDFTCGGSLIAPQWVLTAAHCKMRLLDVVPRQVVVGRADLSDWAHGEMIPIEASFQNPGWDFGGDDVRNDLMLIKLSRPVADPHPVALAAAGAADPPSGAPVRVAGWGYTSQRAATTPLVLRTVEMPVHDWRECRRNWGGDRGIKPTMICTGDKGQYYKSVCNGDSGGPLTYQGTQIGIVSFGGQGCHVHRYPVYTRVASYAAFIDAFFTRSLEPDELSYFLRDRGPRRNALIVLRNESAQTVTVTRVSIERGPFKLVGDRCLRPIVPGASCTIPVMARHLRARNPVGQGDLRIESDSLVAPSRRIKLYSASFAWR
jgi:secreted trypsin-like serine protease